MRGLIFRAWDKAEKKMKLPTLFRLGRDLPFTDDNNAGKVYQCQCNGNSHIEYYSLGDNLILMQFTGLLDKNKVKIFEGDVVEDGTIVDDYGKPFRGLIGFETSAFRLIKTNCDCGECLNSVLISGNELIVIGNLYESPELLNTNQS